MTVTLGGDPTPDSMQVYFKLWTCALWPSSEAFKAGHSGPAADAAHAARVAPPTMASYTVLQAAAAKHADH